MFESGNIAREYDHWFETEAGRFAFAQQKRLIRHLISTWPRRKQSLLDIGCGTGVFLELFWESGFDVYGIDSSSRMLTRAREKLGHRADLHLGKAEYLPFDDNEFDFSTIITVLEFCDEPLRVLKEAARVTQKGILLCFLNKNSAYYLSKKIFPSGRTGITSRARWFSHGEIKKMVKETLGPKKISSLSVLPGPKFMWKDHFPLGSLNKIFWPPGMGAFIGIRLEILESAPLKTPLIAFKNEVGAN